MFTHTKDVKYKVVVRSYANSMDLTKKEVGYCDEIINARLLLKFWHGRILMNHKKSETDVNKDKGLGWEIKDDKTCDNSFDITYDNGAWYEGRIIKEITECIELEDGDIN